ncbi:MAG: LssY C-terminal domain-containing protein [Candidatus Saccharimonadales bacterium]
MPKLKSGSSWYANHFNNTIRLIVFIILFAVAVVLYNYFIHHVFKTKQHFFTYFIIAWLVLTYIILPRVYRLLSKIFLPNYFIGRTRTGDGMLGDPVNLAIIGSENELFDGMTLAGWKRADKLNLNSSLRMIYSAVLGTQYSSAPVSPLFLFGKKQDLAFEKDVGGNPRKRHHARFWRTPKNWWLPGGYKIDWLGAATFDKNVGLSLFTGQVTHKIDSNVDKERDFVVIGLKKRAKGINWVRHFTSSYNSRSGGGDFIHTDGSMPFIRLK